MHLAKFFHLLAATALMATLTSCGDSSDPSVLVERELSTTEKGFNVVETSRERFRYQTQAPPTQGEATSGATGSGNPKLAYDTPEGWEEKPGSSMRDVNFVFGENGEGSCYLARLPGAGGGMVANVNRWRGQFKANPLTEAEIAALPKLALFRQPATLVEVDGPFAPGMGSTDTFDDYRLRGLILASSAGAVFVKMTGPKALVAANSDAFNQFVASLDVKTN
ncbi:hypothetical protein N9B73_09210 [Verrucomicrobiales bacterium]|jgi:hypothetical protein|nr:hypothetical protein [Verrucomicrobiales bacterium]